MNLEAFENRMENLSTLLEGIYTCMCVRKHEKNCTCCPFNNQQCDDDKMCEVVYHATNYIIGE